MSSESSDPSTSPRPANPDIPPAPRRLSGLRRGFIALSYRNYRLFWLGQLVSVTGTWMQTLAIAWLVYEILGATPFELGLVNVLQFLPVLLFGIPAGIIADRFPKRRILLVTQSTMMLVAISFTILVATDVVRLWMVYALATVFGFARSLDMPTRQAFVSELVGKQDLMNAIALNSALFNTGRIVGPAVAGVLLSLVGPALLFGIDAASYLAVLTGLAMMRVTPMTATSIESPLRRLREGLSYIRGDFIISHTILMVGIAGIFGMNFNVWVPVLASDYFNSGSGAYGILFAAMGAGSLLGALSLAFIGDGPNRARMIAAVCAMGVAEFLLALISANTTAIFLGAGALMLIGFATTNAMSTANTTVQTQAADHIRGRVMAVYMTVFAGSIPIGALIAGWATGQLGAPASLIFGGAMVLLAALIHLRASRQPRHANEVSTNGAAATGEPLVSKPGPK